MLKSHFPPKFIIIGFAGTVIMDAVFVTLSGNVPSDAVKNQAADIAKAAKGVSSVTNNLTIKAS